MNLIKGKPPNINCRETAHRPHVDRLEKMNPEPIAPAAPILVHSLNEEEDCYSQQQEVEDRINIDICTSYPCMQKSGAAFAPEKTSVNAVRPQSNILYSGTGAGISTDIRADIRPPLFSQQKEISERTDLNVDHEDAQATVPPPAVTLSQNSVHIQQTPQLQPAVSALTELDLDEDPRYRYVTAQIDPCESQDHCSESCAKCYTHVMQLYSYRTCSRHILQCQCGRFEDLVLNDKLKRSYVAGWAMLMSSVFPLVPNHAVRCFWAAIQLLFLCGNAAAVFVYMKMSTSFSNVGMSGGDIAQTIFISLALLLATCDTLSCFGVLLKTGFSQQRFQPPEAEPLLHRNQSLCKDLLYRYNDLLRLVVAELVVYLILVTALLNYCYRSLLADPQAMIYSSLPLFGICVYVVQFLLFLEFTWTLWRQLKPLPSTRRKAMWLLLCFFLNCVGYRILQTLSLVILVVVNNNFYSVNYYENNDWYYLVSWPVLTTAIFTYLTPIVGILTFPILNHGWILDLCIVYCTDYLSYLNTIQSNPNTGLETKQAIRAALTRFEFETLVQESQKYRKWSRMCMNFVYPFLSPVMFVLSIPNVICLVALFIGARWAAQIEVSMPTLSC